MVDVWGVTLAVIRRWYVVLPLLALSALAAYWAGNRIQAEYEVSGAVILVAPPQVGANPYADDYATEILALRLGSSATRQEFAGRGLSDDYEIEYERRSPVMIIQVVAGTEDVAVRTGEEIVAYMAESLESGQSERDVPQEARVTLEVIDAPDAAEPVVSGRIRVTGVVASAGALLAIVSALVVDLLMTRHRGRRKAPPEGTPKPRSGRPAASATATPSAESSDPS